MLTHDVNLHWIRHKTTLEDLHVMVRELGVSYVIAPQRLRNPAFASDPAAFDQSFRPIGRISGYTIYAPL